jgi:hypothetical protein
MSNRTVEQVKALITADLSGVEKARLIEWLAAGLCQELLADQADQQESTTSEHDTAYDNGASGFAKQAELASQDEIPWEEQPWTQEELRELMRPDPKSGAEIAAMLEQMDLREWQAMDIPDVVEWLHKQRQEERQQRVSRWLEAEQSLPTNLVEQMRM